MMVFFRRYRMQFDLKATPLQQPELPAGVGLHPWSPQLLGIHADVKFRSFHRELDANVFPCLGEMEGCRRLMKEITRRSGFVPESTWLLSCESVRGLSEFCGTVQGIRDGGEVGMIQNIGITPEFRGRGLGSLMVMRSLQGFREAGMRLVTLEVTGKNEGAVRLYERLGFEVQRTVFKSVDVAALQ